MNNYIKKQLYILLLVIGVVITLTGCKKIFNDPYFSFGKVGNEWTYECLSYVYAVDNPDTTIRTEKFKIIEKNKNNLYTYQISNTKRQWYIKSRSFGESKDKIYVKKNSQEYDSYYENQTVLEVDKKIFFKNDSIDCFVIRVGGTSYTKLLYINNEYGIVKIDHTDDLLHRTIWTLIDTNF